MNEMIAKKHLKHMLRDFTCGSILHLLGDIFREQADEASQYEDSHGFERCKTIECTLFVTGCGVDSACPK